MNKQRRNRIEYVKAKLGELKYEIENLQEEEDEEYNNLPENIQDSDQGAKYVRNRQQSARCRRFYRRSYRLLRSVD